MASVPGSAGLPVIGDKSLEFYRDAIAFAERRIKEHDSRIFMARFLNKPTVFVGSNAGIQEVLNDKSSCIDLGYKAFMFDIFGDSILFTDGEEASGLRDTLKSLFTVESVHGFQDTIDRLTEKAMKKLRDCHEPVGIYNFFKRLCTEICLSIFLDIHFENSPELAETIVSLTTTHWHGIISLPVNFQLPVFGSTSTYTKALQAKAKLLEIISTKLANCKEGQFPHQVSQGNFPSQSLVYNHLLLFTCALVPKALASLLTSFVLATNNQEALLSQARNNSETLDNILLEVQRLWPPLQGGRRLVRQNCTIQGFQVQEGHAILYLTHFAQRDPVVFDDPDQFLPDRWRHKNADDRDKLFLFGSGPRCCIGQHLVWTILRTVTKPLVQDFTWEIQDNPDLTYKHLPVSRPKNNIPVKFSKLTDSS